ncbi:MAG: hypothetical protein MJ213_03925 [Bacilli bacterium]|nr:hypothetical protein [Bacilli bacterium]
MRKTLRKIALSILAISSGLSFSAAISNNSHHTQTDLTPYRGPDDSFIEEDFFNEPVGPQNAENAPKIIDDVINERILDIELNKKLDLGEGFGLDAANMILKVVKFAIKIIGIAKGSSDKDELTSLIQDIVTSIAEIYQKVNVINQKMNDIKQTLTTEFADIRSQFSETKIRKDLDIINKFDVNAYDKYDTQLTSLLNGVFKRLSDPDNTPYQEQYKFDMSYLLEFEDNTGYYISIDGDDVENAFIDTKTSNPFDVNDVKGWFNRYATHLFNKYLSTDKEGTGLNRALTRRRELGFTDDTFIDAFANGFYQYLRLAYSQLIFRQSNDYATYIAQIISKFNSYCDPFSKPVSPLLCQYDIFANLFCFQGDTYYYNQFNERRSLVLDIGYAYMYKLLQFGNFVEEAAILSGFVTNDQIHEIENTLSTTLNNITSLMQSFYKVDVNGVPLDNYCYSTGCPIEVVKNNIYTNKPTTLEVEKTSGKIDLEGDLKSVVFGDIMVNEVNKETRLNGDEIAYLSILQGKMPILDANEGDARPTFNEYLNKTFNTEITSNLAVSFDNPRNVTDKNGYIYNAYSFGDPTNPDMKGGMFYNNVREGLDPRLFIMGDSGYNGKDELDDDHLSKISEVRGDYFDLTTNKMVYDDSLFSYAFYYKGNKNWDDIGYFSSQKIAGKNNTISTFNTTCYPSVGDVVFKDQATTIKTVNRDGDARTYEITTNYDVFALNKVNVEYGKVKLDDFPFTSNFTNAEVGTVNSAISDINKKYNLQGDDSIKPIKKNNNDNDYNFIFDKLGDPDNYSEYMNAICSDDNLLTLHDVYDRLNSTCESHFKAINPDTYQDSKYFDSEISGEDLDKCVENIKLYMQTMVDLGFETGGYIRPGPYATDFKIMYRVAPQINEVLSSNHNGEIECKIYPTYTLKPALSFVEGGSRLYGDLPCQTYSLIKQPKDLEIKLPVNVQNLSNKCASIEFNEDVSLFGADSSYIQMEMGEDTINYIGLNGNAFGAYSLINLVDATDAEFELVPSKEPSCSSPGHKVAYKKDSIYYREPNTIPGSEIGNESVYQEWISEGGEGYIPPTYEHHYQFISSSFSSTSKQFTITFKCSDCEKTEQITVNGEFVTDAPATCKEAAKGHYCASGVYEGTSYYVSDETSYHSGDPLAHHLLHHEYKAPTCTVPGNYEYYECLDCGEKFDDAGNPFTDETVIPAINHEGKEHHPRKEPTYEKSGNIEYWYCPHCGYYFLDEACTQRTSLAHIIIPAKQYQFDTFEKKEPNHFEAGHRAYYRCKSTGKYYSDPNGVNEIADIYEWLAPGGEGYLEKESCIFDGIPTYTLEGDTCTATISCSYSGCGQFISETVEVKYVIDTPATCERNDLGHIVAKFDNPAFGSYTTSTNSYEFPDTKLGHDFINPYIIWDGNICTIYGACSECGKKVELSRVGVLVIDEEATCYSNAIAHYEVSFNIAKQPIKSPQFEIPDTMTEHEFGNFEAIWEGNICVLTGKCIHDGCEETITYIQQGTIVIDTPATCTENAKGHYVASFNINGVEMQQTAANSVTIENTILRHEFDEHGECVHCHRASPEAVARKATIDNDALNGAAIAVCCVSGSSLALASFFILKHLRLKKKKL